jgi:hypothetical protein
MKLYPGIAKDLRRYDVTYSIGSKVFSLSTYTLDAAEARRQVKAYAKARRKTAPIEHRNDKVSVTAVELVEE